MAGRPDIHSVVVLDVMLPGIDGIETCKRLRDADVWTPILMLTARDSVRTASRASTAAPTTTSSSRTRSRSCSRASARSPAATAVRGRSSSPSATSDSTRRRIRSGGATRDRLTTREIAILEAFMRRPGRIVSRYELMELAWEGEVDHRSNVVDVAMGRRATRSTGLSGRSPSETSAGRATGYGRQRPPETPADQGQAHAGLHSGDRADALGHRPVPLLHFKSGLDTSLNTPCGPAPTTSRRRAPGGRRRAEPPPRPARRRRSRHADTRRARAASSSARPASMRSARRPAPRARRQDRRHVHRPQGTRAVPRPPRSRPGARCSSSEPRSNSANGRWNCSAARSSSAAGSPSSSLRSPATPWRARSCARWRQCARRPPRSPTSIPAHACRCRRPRTRSTAWA